MSTREKALALRQSNPWMTLVEIAEELNVSKQRIHFILKQAHLPTSGLKFKKVHYCQVCSTPVKYKAKTCKSCRFTYYKMLVNCAFCHVPFFIWRSEIRRRQKYGYNNIYCGRTCYYRGARDGLSNRGPNRASFDWKKVLGRVALSHFPD